jgi:hypothetical protein
MSATRDADVTSEPATMERRTNLREFDASLERVLESFGLDDESIVLLPWIPAIALAWLRGVTERERLRLVDLIRTRHPVLPARVAQLLLEWLRRRPSDAMFRTARRALRAQLRGLAPDERPALRARVISPCVEIADADGGLFGYRTISEEEQTWLRRLTAWLQTDAEAGSQRSGGQR